MKDEMMYKVPNIFARDEPQFLYFISDPPYLIKKKLGAIAKEICRLKVAINVYNF